MAALGFVYGPLAGGLIATLGSFLSGALAANVVREPSIQTSVEISNCRWLQAPATTLIEQAASSGSAACFASSPSSTIRTISPTRLDLRPILARVHDHALDQPV